MIRSTFNVCMFFVLALLIAQVVGAPASKDALDGESPFRYVSQTGAEMSLQHSKLSRRTLLHPY